MYPCAICRQAIESGERVVEVVQLIPAGTTADGAPRFVDGRHHFTHERCYPIGSRRRDYREVRRGETIDVALRRSAR